MYVCVGLECAINNKAANQIWENQTYVHVANSTKIEILLHLASIISGLQTCEASVSIYNCTISRAIVLCNATVNIAKLKKYFLMCAYSQ